MLLPNAFPKIAEIFASARSKKIILAVLLIILFLLPFFWSSQEFVNIGGDDTRFYTSVPLKWFQNMTLYAWFNGFAGNFAGYNPQYFYIPFLFLAELLKIILPFLNSQKIIFGMALSLSFLMVFLLAKEFLPQKYKTSSFLASLIAGLSYVLLPVIFLSNWVMLINSFLAQVGFPLMMLIFIKAFKKSKFSYLIWGSIISIVFSISFSSSPVLLPFLIGFFIFSFLYYCILANDRRRFIKYLISYLVLIVLVNSFWMLPFADSLTKGNVSSTFILKQENKELTSRSVKGLANSMNLSDILPAGFDVEYFTKGKKDVSLDLLLATSARYAGYLIFGLFCAGILLKSKKNQNQKKILIILFLTTLILLYFLTVNIGDWGVKLFTWLLRNLPGMVVIRNFWPKVSLSYGLFYSLTLGLAFFLVFQRLKRRVLKAILFVALILILTIPAIPFIDGFIFNLPYGFPDKTAKLHRNTSFSSTYLKLNDYIGNLKEDCNVASMPFGQGSWSMVLNEEKKNLYIGSSPIRVYAGKNDFNSFLSFGSQVVPQMAQVFKSALESENVKVIENFFSMLNIQYVIYDSKIYDQHFADLDNLKRQYLWLFGANGKSKYENLLSKLNFKFNQNFDGWDVYKVDNDYITPHIYSPSNIYFTNEDFTSAKEIMSFDNFSAKSANAIFSSESMKLNNQTMLDISNEIFVPLAIDKLKIKQLNEKLETTDDPQEKAKIIQSLNKYKNYVILDDEYFIDVPKSETYEIFVKKNSLLANDVNSKITVEIGDEKIENINLKSEEGEWISLGMVDLNEDRYNFKIYADDLTVPLINPSDIILQALNNELSITKLPEIVYKKINPTKYRIQIKNATEAFPLVFSESFHNSWRLYPVEESPEKQNGNYMSESIKGTVQNDNLPNGKFYETWLKKFLPDENHLLINGYANFWLIDPNDVKVALPNIKQNSDGSYNFEMILEFSHQKKVYAGLIVSVLSLSACTIYLIKKRKLRKSQKSIYTNNSLPSV